MSNINFINITSEEYKNILNEMMYKWGEESQIDKCIEECSELIKALCDLKNRRAKCVENVISELADVSFTVDQISNIVGFDKMQSDKNHKFKEIEPVYEYYGKGFE